jgi:hypothetical protein
MKTSSARLSVIIVSCLLFSQINITPIHAQDLSTKAQSIKAFPGWTDIERLKPRFVVFGEVHGTQEAPYVFGEIVKSLSNEGKRILVAVELFSCDDDHFQQVWNTEHKHFAERLTAKGWSGGKDGVRSVAMLKMLTELHEYKSKGGLISITAFNGPKNEQQEQLFYAKRTAGGHEIAQARNIIDTAEKATFDYVMILVGNVHASKTMIDLNATRYLPMAAHLSNNGKVISLNMASAGGSSWNCQRRPDAENRSSRELECKVWEGRIFDAKKKAPYIRLSKSPRTIANGQYDGYFWVGVTTGSPPAKP